MSLFFESLLSLQKSTGLSFIPLSILISVTVIIILATFVKAVSDLLSAIPTLRKNKGTTAEVFFKKGFLTHTPINEENYLLVDNNEKLFSMVKNKEVDFILYDYIRSSKVVKTNSDLEQIRLTEKGFIASKENYGIAVSNIDKDLLELINKILKQSKGEINELKRKYDLIYMPQE